MSVLTRSQKKASVAARERITHLQREILFLRHLQRPFGETFWRLEQRIALLSDEIERLAT